MKLAWYVKLYIYAIFTLGMSALVYSLYSYPFTFDSTFFLLILSVVFTSFFSEIPIRYSFNFSSVWNSVIYFHYGIGALLLIVFLETLLESIYHNKINSKIFFNIGQLLIANWGAHLFYQETKLFIPDIKFLHFVCFYASFVFLNTLTLSSIFKLADIFDKKIIFEVILLYLIFLPIYGIVFSSFHASPLLTIMLVPTALFFIKNMLLPQLKLTFEDERLESESYICSRQFFFHYMTQEKNFTFPFWLTLVENTQHNQLLEQEGKQTFSKNMIDFIINLRNLCGPQLFCRYTSNRILIISHAPLCERLKAAQLSFSTKKIDNNNFNLESLLSELELKLNQLTRQAAKQRELALSNSIRLATIGQLAAGLAHEIRNPLTAVKGFLQLYSLGNSLDWETLQLIKAELNRINQLVTDLLYLSAPLTVPQNLEQHDLNQLAREVAELLKPEFQAMGVQLELQLAALPLVAMDKNQLKQVLLNLVQNALQAVPTRQGQVVLETARQNARIIVRIRDNGPGIPPELQERIFDPFYTTKEHGTGLGLTICRQLIKAHGGQIRIDSQPGQTLFEFSLPLN